MVHEPVYIIGVGVDGPAGLSQAAREIIERANELWGSERLLAMWPAARQKIVLLGKDLAVALQALAHRLPGRQVVILASGDPGFYGVAANVLKTLPAEEVRVFPQVSCLQAAFARINVHWGEAAFTSAHARPVSEVIGLARRFPKVGILTDPTQSPPWMAAKLLAAGIPECRAVVCENLGQADEKITNTRLVELPQMDFAPLNVLLLIHDPGWKPAPAFAPRPDSAYRHKRGLITKSDVRAISIARLGICETDVIWDIGAGSGAVSIEMAEIAWRGQVFAIEKDEECLACLRENITHYGVTNVQVIAGEAPQASVGLPPPSVAFIGGSSGKLVEILAQIEESAPPGCRVAANFTLLENLLLAFNWMQARGWEPALSEMQFSYGIPTAGGTRLAPANPVFILSAVVHKKGGICQEN